MPRSPGTLSAAADPLLTAIVESSDDAIVSKTLDGIVTSWNRAAERLFGYAADEIIGRPISVLAAPGREDEMPAILSRVRRGERVEHMETVRRRKDGVLVEVSLTVSPVRDREGRIVGASKIARDIAAARRQAGELRRREAEYRAIFEAGDAAKAEVEARSGRFLRVNRAYCELLGYAEAELLGMTAWDVTHPEDRGPNEASYARLAAGQIDRFRYEKRYLRKDGAAVWVLVSAVLLPGGDGGPERSVAVVQDITEAKRREAELRDREARLRSILETAPEAIVTIDERGLVISFSPAAEALFGHAASEVLGRNVSLLMPEPHQGAHDRYIARYLATGERRIIGIGREIEGRRKDGTTFPMELAVGEARSNGDRFFTGFVRDLTARKRLEQELSQAQRMEAVGQLTGGVAHDFNNLLTVVMGNLEMLEDRLDGDEEALLLLGEAREAARLGAELTGRLLAFGRRQPLRPRAVDLARAVPDAVALLRRTLGETVEVATVLAPDLPRAMADPAQLQNALLNLAINARDAMPGGGRLTIEAGALDLDGDAAATRPGLRPGRYVMLAVTDTGAGMPTEVRERAFEPFFTTKGPGEGSGLGLAMVYGFAKQSGGHVDLYSEVGRGTVVKLFLPRAAEGGTGEEAERAAAAWPGRGETVLVAEDEAAVRRVTTARLRALGYRVLEVADGPSALAELGRQPGVELLLTDMVMPGGMTGTELAAAARALRPGLAVVVVSGYAAPEGLDGLPAGAAWLRKPYAAADLARVLRDALGRRGA